MLKDWLQSWIRLDPQDTPNLRSDPDAKTQPRLRELVEKLSLRIGERNIVRRTEPLAQCARYLEDQLRATGLSTSEQRFSVEGESVRNLFAVQPAASADPADVLVVGAHYDSVVGSPGANDNGSGVAAMIRLAERMPHLLTASPMEIHYVAFVNEEAPFFGGSAMGSLRYARELKRHGRRVAGMMSLETMGYFSNEPGSQEYPAPLHHLFPDRGDFIAFVANLGSRKFLRSLLDGYGPDRPIPALGACLPSWIPGVSWSDHWSFWEEGYPALMITDTAPYRYPYYHTAQDRPEHVNFDALAAIETGLEDAILSVAEGN